MRSFTVISVAFMLVAGLFGMPSAHARGRFVDDDGHIFELDIERLAASGIAKGCDVDRFCPDRSLRRGQLAAFLHRALGSDLDADGGSSGFTDIADSEFRADIEWLAATGITKGCSTTRFCPDDRVTRGQIAAFLVRALGLTRSGGVDFSDDDHSVFEADIEKLAAAGITKGCGSNRFCPEDFVTRGEMAAFLVRAGFGGDLPDGFFGEGEYDAAELAGVKNGLSGMFVSRKNPGIHWFVVDHLGLHSSNHTLFAIDAANRRLVWRGKFDRSGSGGAIDTWADVEDLTGVKRNGEWYLAIWDNGTDSVYELAEPTVRVGQSRASVDGIKPSRIVRPQGQTVGSGNVEAMAWSESEDAMYWVAPRGSGNDLNDDARNVMRVSGWSDAGSSPRVSTIGHVVGRPSGTNVPNAIGAMDISVDGRTMVIQGVGTSGDRENAYAMVHRRSSGESWAEYFDRVDKISTSRSIRAGAPSENVALDPRASVVFTAGEGRPGSSWSAVFRYELP